MIYQLYKTSPDKTQADAAYFVKEDGSITSFIFHPDNTDYQAYLKWVAEGNTPLPAEEA